MILKLTLFRLDLIDNPVTISHSYLITPPRFICARRISCLYFTGFHRDDGVEGNSKRPVGEETRVKGVGGWVPSLINDHGKCHYPRRHRKVPLSRHHSPTRDRLSHLVETTLRPVTLYVSPRETSSLQTYVELLMSDGQTSQPGGRFGTRKNSF